MTNILCKKVFADNSFIYVHRKDEDLREVDLVLHNHEGYEILVVLDGSAEFIVEGSVYSLGPMDIVIARPDEMHQLINSSQEESERIVINLYESFFSDEQVQVYLDVFLNRSCGEGNLFDGELVKNSELFDVLLRLERYIKENVNELLIRCIVIELLHHLNNLKKTDGKVQNPVVKKVIYYICNHLNEDLSLDALAKKFYVSKYNLCRCFRKCTGFTVNQYITRRRIMVVQELYKKGKRLSEASNEAGFADYSNFYKAYVRETGYSPTEGMRRIKQIYGNSK